MTAADLTELNRFTSRKVIPTGAEVHGQGEPIQAYANILRGVIKLTKIMADGRQQIVGLQFAPHFIGRPFADESAITAEAATDMEICTVSKPALDRLMANNPDLEHKLYNQALTELDEARDWMLTLGRKTARERVASFLNLIASHFDTLNSDGICFDLPLTRQDMGDFLGLTIETVSRQMTRLRNDGIIKVAHSRCVTVPSRARLAKASGNHE
jgi:CRP/FNR family transcriptional regulator